MSRQHITNIAASVHAKLVNQAKENRIDVNILRMRYAIERFLYRLSLSKFCNKFTLKGAMLFLLWSDENFRPTKDSDFLLTGELNENIIESMIKEICSLRVEDDAVHYHQESMQIQKIKEDQDYEGLRVTFSASVGNVLVPLQLDIGTGDIITPTGLQSEFPTIIKGSPAPMLYVYSRETVIAEKLEAMVKLDLANSRMKDFYDIWIITQKLGFDKNLLKQAIDATFKRRKTPFPDKGISSLTPSFYNDSKKNVQWNAFLKKGSVKHNKLTLQQVCEDIKKSLEEIFNNSDKK